MTQTTPSESNPITSYGSTAESMLQAASAMAAQASSGAEGLEAVSSALLNQAKAQAFLAETSLERRRDSPSQPMAKTLSLSYSAAMSAHIATALESHTAKPLSSSSSSSSAHHTVGQIAARAAAHEAQNQLRAHALLRSTVDSKKSVQSLSQVAMSASEYLEHLGLSHVAMPSVGLEQSWGRTQHGKRYWDASNPAIGFNPSGVPSMPLMPAPPLQMLPPPASPSFCKRLMRNHVEFQPDSARLAESAGHARDYEPNVMSPLPYPFQVVQTPGGTARAGWWVPPSHVSPEKRASAIRFNVPSQSVGHPQTFAAAENQMALPAQQGSNASSSELQDGESPFFQPSFRDFTPDEYQTLASAAAYATAAMTSIASPVDPSTASGSIQANWRPLNPTEQESIANQLRAWAGLQGPDKQAQARQALEERQAHIISQATQSPLPPTMSQQRHRHPSALVEPSNANRFFPPDFASHYRTQLQALTEGYYTKLHNEGLLQRYWAEQNQMQGYGPSSSGTVPSLNAKALDHTNRHDNHQGITSAATYQAAPQASLPESVMMDRPPVSTPKLLCGAQDPVQLLSAASNAAGRDVTSPEVRDQLLQYAHGLYSTGNKNIQNGAKGVEKLHPTLLPLLHTLHKLHPQHLPTLLLLSCAYYAADNHAGSLWYNNLILSIDPTYVESMSNVGTTLRALGRCNEAESWWWRAIKLRPGYWDAFENLLGVMCSPIPNSSANSQSKAETQAPRFRQALKLCEFVESNVVGRVVSIQAATPPNLTVPPHLPITQTPRLQNLYYAKGNLNYILSDLGIVPAALQYQNAVELVLSPSEQIQYGLRDLVVATCVFGLLSMRTTLPGSATTTAALEVATSLGINLVDPNQAALVSAGMFTTLYPGGLLALIHASGDGIVQTLLRLGNGQLPMLMLLPEAAMQLNKVLFADTGGILPAMYATRAGQRPVSATSLQQAQKQAAQTSSTILLTLAKLFQDATVLPAAGRHGPLVLGGIPASTSLLLPLYYLSISLHPSASTFNNLGILLSSIPIVTTVINAAGQPQQLNGQAMAMQYYTYGLQLDPKHPHLYTNLGSLLKDLGHLNEAIKMYESAVECNPNFDVALANLGNAIKDQGRTQDSVTYYRRAVQVNPKFPEALCGLVNALLAICDWREVYPEDSSRSGWMTDVSELVSKQLRDGCQYGTGALQSQGQLDNWIHHIVNALGDTRPNAVSIWTSRFNMFFQNFDRVAASVSEGGFVIRLIERAMKRAQRRWYLEAYGKALSTSTAVARIGPRPKDSHRYARMKLPSCLVTPAVPTVLPFHTFTYPLSPRQIRLICHRNALRISQGTLTQAWLPEHVYPPPSPPSPKISIGYISSDFNNHPLSHLMQSVFGFHDLTKFNIFLYATTPSDASPYRQKIERETQHFIDVSSWSNQQIVERVVLDNIHILINLNGYTKGARNEVFAARPCPVQMEFMGFAGSLASGWNDWIVADPVVCPPELTSVELWRQRMSTKQGLTTQLRPTDLGADTDPEEPSDDWVYSDRFIYMPHSYFVNDHAQGFREPTHRPGVPSQDMSAEETWVEEEQRRYAMRKQLFPNLPDDYLIFADFNQLYKCDPILFKLWLRILKRVPKSILWLLRFPASGESHLLREAQKYAGDEVASRVIFTDVAPKDIHIHRGRIADLFLDMTECNAHTTAADILWSATPILTWPRHKHKMCSRVAASIARATGYGGQMEVDSEQAYEDRAVELANSVGYVYVDKHGKRVDAEEPDPNAPFLTASCLEADPNSVSAQSYSTSSGSGSGSKSSCDSRADSSSSEGQSGFKTDEASTAALQTRTVEPAPAPTRVRQMANANANDSNAQTDASLRASLPPRAFIRLPVSTKSPKTAISRRGYGELIELRKTLFLTRDKSPLFDTRQWVKDLEKGYMEAWRRWVEGTDMEDSPEWEALPINAKERASGHIWVADL